MIRQACFLLVGIAILFLVPLPVGAQTFFYVGPASGDFFDEANWNDAADGTGSSPAGDPLVDSTTNAIALDLIIDGDTVDAAGDVDFGTGSLTLEAGSIFSITDPGADLDINALSSFSLTDASLIVDDIINFEGTSTFSGGSVLSQTDDIAFQDNFVNLSIDGTSFTSNDNTYFDGFVGTIINATINSADRLGLRNNTNVTMTNSDLTINAGAGDIDDVFTSGTGAAGSSLTLNGSSTLLADSVEEGADLILGGTTVAMMGGGGVRIAADGSTITIENTLVQLIVGVLDGNDIDYEDARPFLINGLTGLSYTATNGAGWSDETWNGTDAITLQVVPEPSSLLLALACLLAATAGRRRVGAA